MLKVENGRFWGGEAFLRIIAVPAWHGTVHHTVNYRNCGKLRSSKIINTL